jgi:SAM-dependent methyltransferase
MPINTNCAVCGENRVTPFWEKAGYRIVQCPACGFLYVNPRPDRQELSRFYQNPAYFQGSEGYGYADYFADREMIERQSADRLKLIERLTRRGNLLDVGCASGFFLKVAKDRGWAVEGIEVSEAVSHFAEQLIGQPIHPGLSAAQLADESFDAVTLWEYIEHVLDPREELQRVKRLLKPGGVIALSSPNAGQAKVKTHPEQWREFKPPEHLSFFSAETLLKLLRECGFEPVITRGIVPSYEPSAKWQQFLAACREALGDRLSRATAFWWIYSVVRRLILYPTIGHHKLFLSEFDYCEGIEIYARKVE